MSAIAAARIRRQRQQSTPNANPTLLAIPQGKAMPTESADPVPTTLAEFVSVHALASYRSGEIDFQQMMATVNRVASARSTPEIRRKILGDLAIRALAKPQRVAKALVNRSRPQYPTWLKNFAIGLVRQLDEWSSDSDPSAPTPAAFNILAAIQLLAELRLYPAKPGRKMLSEAALRKWVQKRQRELGVARPRGRPRRK